MKHATGRFLLLMTSLSPVDLAITGIFVAVSGREGVFGLDLLANVAIFGLLNVALAYRLFRPIARAFGGNADMQAACARIRALPGLAALQAAGLGILYCLVVTYLGVFNPKPEALEKLDKAYVLAALFWYAIVYALYYSFYIYFLINDYLYWLRPRLARSGLSVPSAGRRMRTKLLAVFLIVAVTPTVLAILDLTFFREIRAAQGLTLNQQIFFDLLASAFWLPFRLSSSRAVFSGPSTP